jgi:hypothetical protein
MSSDAQHASSCDVYFRKLDGEYNYTASETDAACIQAEWFAVDSGVAADTAWCWCAQNIYCAQGMLRIIHIKLAANVAIATSKTESAEKKESVDACWSSLERLYPAVSAAAMADGMVAWAEMDFWLEVEGVEYLTTHGYWIANDLCDGSVTVLFSLTQKFSCMECNQ